MNRRQSVAAADAAGAARGPDGTAADRAGGRILVIDDEPNHAEITAEILERDGHACTVVTTGQAGLRQLQQRETPWDLVITDLRMKDVDGMQILAKARELHPEAGVILITAHGTIDTAVSAMEQGAWSFITKPVNMDELRSKVEQAMRQAQLVRENRALRELVSERYGFEGIIGSSEPMRRIFDELRAIAPTDVTVLITGESGTGKELIAKAIHSNSPRARKRFKAINCATLEGTLLQDQLFGHVKGAYTTADYDKEGVFEYADGGTLFLDEIGEMPVDTQAMLLRVLEEKQVSRLGSNKPIDVNVRIVAATNRDLDVATGDGRFREDLHARLRTFRVHLPPLANRRDDIPLLAQHFLRQYRDAHNKPQIEGFAAEALGLLRFAKYPGNVRDLQAVVQRCIIFGKGPEISREEVEAQLASVSGTEPPGGALAEGAFDVNGLAGITLKQAEEVLIRNTLRQMDNNRERTARALGISERTLYRKIKEYGL